MMNRLAVAVADVLSRLPLRILYVVADLLLYPLTRHVVRYRRTVVEKNLALAFPEKEDRERQSIEKAFYHQLCDFLVETVRMRHMSLHELQERFQWRRLDIVRQQCLDEQKSALLYLAHYGQWEWAIGSLLPDASARSLFVYSELHNSAFNQWMMACRSRFGNTPVRMQDTSSTIERIQQEKANAIIIAIADQLPKEQYVRHFHRFMGIKTKVLTGTEQLVRKYDMNVFYCRVERVRRGYYTCTVEQMTTEEAPTANDWPYTDAYFDRLQHQLRKEPELWLWSHDRWRR